MFLINNYNNKINTIDELNEICKSPYFDVLSNYNLSIDMLTYYINNYNTNWFDISYYQPLTYGFINEHIDKIVFINLFHNYNVFLSYRFLEKHLYRFNLYQAYRIVNKATTSYSDVMISINKLIEKYNTKFEVDKLEYEISK